MNPIVSKSTTLLFCLLPILLDGNFHFSSFLKKYENPRQNSKECHGVCDPKGIRCNLKLRGGHQDEQSTAHNPRDRQMSHVELLEILTALLLPNSTAIREAETSLNGCAMRPRFVEAMVDIILNSRTPLTIRQLAGTVMRRKIELVWDNMDENEQTAMQMRISDAILSEPAPQLRRQLALLFGSTVKLSSTIAQLDAMVRRVAMTCTAEEPVCRELGVELMHNLVEDLGDEMRSHHDTLLEICESALADLTVIPARGCFPRARARARPHASATRTRMPARPDPRSSVAARPPRARRRMIAPSRGRGCLSR